MTEPARKRRRSSAPPAPTAADVIRSRIVGELEDVAPDQLLAHPLNFRRHPAEQLEVVRGSMRSLGWLKPVIVNKPTGRILDGHARVEEALRLELATIPVQYVELSEEEERVALAVLDPSSELAMRDDDAVTALLAQVSTTDEALAGLFAPDARGRPAEPQTPADPAELTTRKSPRQLRGRSRSRSGATGSGWGSTGSIAATRPSTPTLTPSSLAVGRTSSSPIRPMPSTARVRGSPPT